MFRPARFAWYSASSEKRSRCSCVVMSFDGKNATPIEAVTPNVAGPPGAVVGIS